MPTRAIALITWLVLVALAVFLAPPARPDTWPWIQRLMTGDWAGEPPWVVAEFQLMGVWPLVLAAIGANDLRARPVPAWPFVLGSMVMGAFVLLPWFVIATPTEGKAPRNGRLERVVGHPAVGAVAGVMALGWIGWAALHGDLAAFEAVRAREGFVWTMTFDFAALWIASILWARRDAHARGGGHWAVTFAPLVGGCAWILLRPRPG